MNSESGSAQRALAHVTPVNRDFRIPPRRVSIAKRAAVKLTSVLVLLTIIAVIPWIIVPPVEGLSSVHWISFGLGTLVVAAAIMTWRISAAARWWQDEGASVVHVTNDEIVIRGTIRIPTNVIAGVWAYEYPETKVFGRPLAIRRWISELGASTTQLTILVNSLAPVIDPHHHVRRFHKGEEVAGRIEVPVGAYLDEPGTTDAILDSFASAVTPGRPVMQVASGPDYGCAWSGFPSRIRATTAPRDPDEITGSSR